MQNPAHLPPRGGRARRFAEKWHSIRAISCHTHKPGCNQYLDAPATIKYLIKVAGKVDPMDGPYLICFMIC